MTSRNSGSLHNQYHKYPNGMIRSEKPCAKSIGQIQNASITGLLVPVSMVKSVTDEHFGGTLDTLSSTYILMSTISS